MHHRFRRTAAVALLVCQVVAIIYARFTPARYFCWAPYDTQDRYRVFVEIDDLVLTEKQTNERYRFSSNAWQQHSIRNLLEAIEQYELSYGSDDNAEIEVRYSHNGRAEQTWNFPR